MANNKKITLAILCGLMGCVCFGVGDWLMLYGDTAYSGTISWLTTGAAQIAPWRNNLAMALAFPGIVLHGVALFAIGELIIEEGRQKVYHYLTVFSLTPWLCLHLFYIMLLYGFAWMSGNGYASAAIPVSEAVFSHFSWLVLVSEALMLPPYLYWAGWCCVNRAPCPGRWFCLIRWFSMCKMGGGTSGVPGENLGFPF